MKCIQCTREVEVNKDGLCAMCAYDPAIII